MKRNSSQWGINMTYRVVNFKHIIRYGNVKKKRCLIDLFISNAIVPGIRINRDLRNKSYVIFCPDLKCYCLFADIKLYDKHNTDWCFIKLDDDFSNTKIINKLNELKILEHIPKINFADFKTRKFTYEFNSEHEVNLLNAMRIANGLPEIKLGYKETTVYIVI